MTRRWWFLLALGFGLLTGCTGTSQATRPLPVFPPAERIMNAAPQDPYAHAPGSERAAEVPPQPAAPDTHALVATEIPAPPAPPAAGATPTPEALPAVVPPEVFDALTQALTRELAGDQAGAIEILRKARLPDSAARHILATVRSALPSSPPPSVAPAPRPAAAPLTVTKACFCKRVLGFGLYDPLPMTTKDDQPAFLGGTEGRPGERVLLYLEVGNFQTATSQVDGVCLYETNLTGCLLISKRGLDKAAPRTIQIPREVRPSRSRRQDYFMRLEFNIPQDLGPGSYTLEVVLDDETPGPGSDRPLRHAQKTLEFRVVEAR